MVSDRQKNLEAAYEEVQQLAADRKARLIESRKLWQFYWDMADEEGWVKEKEQLMSSPDLGHDLTSVHLLLQVGLARTLSVVSILRHLQLKLQRPFFLRRARLLEFLAQFARLGTRGGGLLASSLQRQLPVKGIGGCEFSLVQPCTELVQLLLELSLVAALAQQLNAGQRELQLRLAQAGGVAWYLVCAVTAWSCGTCAATAHARA